jgi:hypothetical protein
MDWIAQKLVNIIGFVDIISQKIQEGLGKIPISLFDQAAADSEKINEELEAAANVSAGFDELHDIGTDSSGANDLLGDIYTPQLSDSWKELANQIGDLFKGVITGDLGFGEVMDTILKLLGKTLKNIASSIWEWFKNTAIGKYITTHWDSILGTVFKLFVGWELLKIAGSTLFNALFGNFTETAISGVFSKVGSWISSILSTTVGSTIMTVLASVAAWVVGDKIAESGKEGLSATRDYNAGVVSVGGSESEKQSYSFLDNAKTLLGDIVSGAR